MLHLIRHGRTAANAAGLFQGHLDNPIDEVGVAQAALLRGAIPVVDRLICSPLVRTHQTATAFDLAPEIDRRWIELDFGPFDGTPFADVPMAEWQRWMAEPDFAPEGCESLRSLATRVGEACAELFDESRRSEIVVVSHAMPVMAAMAWTLGADVSVISRSFVDHASITTIGHRGDRPLLVGFNRQPGT